VALRTPESYQGSYGLGWNWQDHSCLRVCYTIAVEAGHRDRQGRLAFGKETHFFSIQGKLVPTTRCDFQDIDTFLDAALLQIGYVPEDIGKCVDRDDKIDLAVEGFTQFGILLIVDDVDSLPPNDQSDLFAVVTRIIYSASPKSDASRSLFTSRLELNTGADQKIIMTGFTDEEFCEYLEMTLSELQVDEKIRLKIIQGKNRIKEASAGSPIFITSIIRLATLGYGFNESINQWKRHKGEEVREFAFQTEIDHLHDKETANTLRPSAVVPCISR
jgi:hypothetical protein